MLLAGLGAGAVGVAAAAAPVLSLRLAGGPSASVGSWWDRTFLSLPTAGLGEWTALVGQTFTLETAKGTHLLRIAAVAAFPKSGTRPSSLGRSQAFSVTFETAAGPALPATDNLYQLGSSAYPPLPIYMGAPVTAGQKSRLIAIFN
ncbi:MAG: hypothetical protein QOJ27_1768 [Sphingomonadales bacterium]|nr:hypothetical protein [Sphingomonadales bacterium]